MSTVILLGAGASKGTLGADAPISDEFGQIVNKRIPDWRDQYPYLTAAIQYFEPRIPDTSEKSWHLDKVWSAIDNRWKLRYILGSDFPGKPKTPPMTKRIYINESEPWIIAGFELRCCVTQVYGELLDKEIQKAIQGNGTVKTEIQKLGPGDCVISLNYDLLPEKIMDKVNIEWTIPWKDTGKISDSLFLCKPHGSLNWIQYSPENGKDVEIKSDAMQYNDIDFNPSVSATVQPGIIGPVLVKSELFFPELQIKEVPNFFNLVIAQWRCAIKHISEADKIVIMGYSFPGEDIHTNPLFIEAAASRKNKAKLDITFYEKSNKQREVKERIDKIFKIKSQFIREVKP